MSEWIPVGERLPEDDVDVLAVAVAVKVRGEWEDYTQPRCRVLSHYGPLGWYYGSRVYRVTHWQPLPPLPEGVGETE